MAYKLNKKYAPILNTPTRYIIITGGRGSGKSYALATCILDSTFEDAYTVLYTRWNMTSAEVSIIPEYQDKIDAGDCASSFIVRSRDITNVGTGGMVLFRGLQANSKTQIARMKSITKLKTWVLDEAQELQDESLFDTVDLSIREKAVHNKVILVLNPTSVQHWIYRRFFKEAGVADDFNGIKGDVTYIHTDYRDNLPYLNDTFLAKAEKMRRLDFEKYQNIFLGLWAKQREGLIFKNWTQIHDAEYPSQLPQWYGVDWGYSDDPTAIVRMCYDPLRGRLYLKEVCYKTGMLPRDVGRTITADAQSIGYANEYCVVYCDPARPEARDELRIHYGIDAQSANNRDKAGRIGFLRGFNVYYVGDNIKNEADTYSYKPKAHDESRYTDEPEDGNDHLMDAINYGAVTHLRRLGISNDIGEN